MLKKDYSKQRIISLAEEYGDLEHEFDRTTMEKRLEEILTFLNEKAVKDLLENRTHDGKDDIEDSFYIKVMNITRAEGGAYDSYDYNVVDAIFLGILLSLFNHSVFKKIRSKNKPIIISSEEEWNWIEEFRSKIYNFKTVWENYKKEANDKKRERKVRKVNLNEIDDREVKLNFLKIKQKQEEKDPKSWEVVNINIQSLLYKVVMVGHERKAVENRQTIEDLIKVFETLPEHHQVIFYKKRMKNRIETMLEEIDVYIEDLKLNKKDEYKLYEFHKNLYEIDEKFR